MQLLAGQKKRISRRRKKMRTAQILSLFDDSDTLFFVHLREKDIYAAV